MIAADDRDRLERLARYLVRPLIVTERLSLAQGRARGLRPATALEERHLGRRAELLKRVLEIDVLTCSHCGGKRKLIALITDGMVLRKILQHLGLPSTAPTLAPACSPPELEFAG